jgi:hypothetical protein
MGFQHQQQLSPACPGLLKGQLLLLVAVVVVLLLQVLHHLLLQDWQVSC